ncbi:MAG: conjugal transfer protein TraX [Clostridiales bacterium]|nr:conjugal transfer protein TraX [Clostridiales bacterium]
MAPERGLRPWQRCSGSELKWVAIVAMFIDHLGYTLVWSVYLQSRSPAWYEVYVLMRVIGRIAFPVFCFLLVEGFRHTRSRGRYALRLGVFCLVAEIPFDIAFNDPENGFLELDSQNVFFTLLLGFLALWLWDALARRLPRRARYLSAVIALIPGYLAGELLRTDYGGFGVLLILALGVGYGLPVDGAPGERQRQIQTAVGCLAILWYCAWEDNWIEIYAIFGLLLTLTYNGQRGSGKKWFFYIFYPAHLLALGLLDRLLF